MTRRCLTPGARVLGKLPGFDHLAVARDCGSVSDATFRIWRGRAGEGTVIAEILFEEAR